MREMTVKELTEIIESVHEAVDASEFGPVYQYSNQNNPATGIPDKIVSPLAAQIFSNVLNQVLAKVETIKLVPDKKPSAFEQN